MVWRWSLGRKQLLLPDFLATQAPSRDNPREAALYQSSIVKGQLGDGAYGGGNDRLQYDSGNPEEQLPA